MSSIAQVAQAMQTILTNEANTIGAEIGFTKRPDKAKFSPSTLLQTLVFGWMAHPDASLEQLAQSAARIGVEVSPQAIDQRFNQTCASLLQRVLAATLQHVIAADPVALPVLERFSGVRVQDSTTIVLPDALADVYQGCGGNSPNTAAALKCGVQLDVLTGQLTALELVDGCHSDRALDIQTAPLPEGSLRLADLGFFATKVLQQLSEARVYWLTRLLSTISLWLADGTRTTLHEFVSTQAAEGWDGWVKVGEEQVAGRLVVVPVPQEVADARRRRLRKEARDKGREPSAVALALARWTILLTNVPLLMLTSEEAMVVMRVRWQIELLFKHWKMQGLVDEWRTSKPMRILCEVYAKLIAQVLEHWAVVMGCWAYPERSLVKAGQVVRDHAPELASARGRLEHLVEALETIQRVLKRTARMNPRSKHPNTYQRLLDLTTSGRYA